MERERPPYLKLVPPHQDDEGEPAGEDGADPAEVDVPDQAADPQVDAELVICLREILEMAESGLVTSGAFIMMTDDLNFMTGYTQSAPRAQLLGAMEYLRHQVLSEEDFEDDS